MFLYKQINIGMYFLKLFRFKILLNKYFFFFLIFIFLNQKISFIFIWNKILIKIINK